jgi:hypothetical protein
MGQTPQLWLNNLPTQCITSWGSLSQLFTTNYQATYNRPGNTHHLTRVRMKNSETLREYTNRYFENRNTLVGVKDKDIIAYHKKGVTNLKLFERIHEANANTIADLMNYVDKLVDTQDAVVHDFKGDKVDEASIALVSDAAIRSRKRSVKVYVTDAPRRSTFLEGDFNCTLDGRCQFHLDAKNTMHECEQLKSTLGILQNPRRLKRQ